MTESNQADLLYQWEQNYKKGLLTFWILLSLTKRPMYAYEMKETIHEISQGSITADEKSIYRALKRYSMAKLVQSETRASEVGPDRKYFELTKLGRNLLIQFIERNIFILNAPEVKSMINKIINTVKKQGVGNG